MLLVGHSYIVQYNINTAMRPLEVLGNLLVERAKDAVCFLQWCGIRLLIVVSSAIIYNVVSEKVTC